ALVVLVSITASGETWITIKGESSRLRKFSRCSILASGTRDGICDCCLIKQSIIHKLDEASAMSVCEKKQQCQFDKDSSYYQTNTHKVFNRAKKRLKVMTIVKIEKLLNISGLPKDGMLTSEDISDIVFALKNQGYLSLPSALFADAHGLK